MASALVLWATSALQTYLVGWVGQRALQDLRIRLFAHLQTLSIGFHSRRRAGVLVSRLTNDVQALDQLVSDGVVTLFQSSLTLVGTIAILLWLDVELALLTFLVLPRAAGRARWPTGWRRPEPTGSRARRSPGSPPTCRRRCRACAWCAPSVRSRATASASPSSTRTTARPTCAPCTSTPPTSRRSSCCRRSPPSGILLYGGYQAIAGEVTIGVLVAFVAALANFFDPIQQLSQLYTTYQSGMAALDKIFELLDEEPDLVDRPGAVALGRMRGALELRGRVVPLRATGASWALRDVDLRGAGRTDGGAGRRHRSRQVDAGQAGRALLRPHRGTRARRRPRPARRARVVSLRSQLGIVPQEGFLFSGTIRDNIAFGRPDATDDEIAAAARAVGADEFVAGWSDGYDTEVGERGSQLSAGQRQLIAFARALIADPRILILDEATSNVDIHTEARIEAGLRRLLAGRTAIVIAHRLSTIRRAGRIVVLDGGRDRRAGHPRGAAGGPRRLLAACTATGPSRRRS